jgi:hypothetical protein
LFTNLSRRLAAYILRSFLIILNNKIPGNGKNKKTKKEKERIEIEEKEIIKEKKVSINKSKVKTSSKKDKKLKKENGGSDINYTTTIENVQDIITNGNTKSIVVVVKQGPEII